MKYLIKTSYYDKQLKKLIKVGDIIDVDDDRAEELSNAGIQGEELIEENLEDKDELSDDLDEDRIKSLMEHYKADKNSVDELKASDLKLLCDELNVNYVNVGEAKEALKILTIG